MQWRCNPTRVMASSFLIILDHIQRRTTVGRTPLDEWSARRRDLYLTTHNINNRQISMPPSGIRTHDLSRRAAADLRLRPRGQQYTYTHKNTENDTKQTIHTTTQNLGRVRTVPRLCGFYPGICCTTEEKAWKNLSQYKYDNNMRGAGECKAVRVHVMKACRGSRGTSPHFFLS